MIDAAWGTTLLVGGTGFVGRHLAVRLTAADARVVCLGRKPWEQARRILPPQVNYICRDSSDQDPVCLAGDADAIVHLACDVSVGNAISEPEEFVRTNFEPTLLVASMARRMVSKPTLIYLSSDRVYGASTGTLTESSLAAPVDPYGAVKLAGENLLGTFARMFEIPLVIIRAASVYGPFQRPVQFIPHVIRRIRAGETRIPVGDIRTSRNFLYIEDLVEGLLSVLRRPKERQVTIYNMGGGVHNIGDVISTIQALAHEKLARSIDFYLDEGLRRPEGSQLAPALLSSAKAAVELGWEPRVSLWDGLARTLEYEEESYGPSP